MLLTDVITLTGEHVQLEPLSAEHIPALQAAAGEITEDLWYTAAPSRDEVEADVAMRLAKRDAGDMNPFAVRSLVDGTIVGETTFCDIEAATPRVEIGYTWYAPRVRGTALNPEAKLLLLGHAFDACGVIATVFSTHAHNHRSRAAIAKLGAKQDGILRNHSIGSEGTLRDTVYFSILPHEWPTVRRGLQARIRDYGTKKL